MGARQGFLHGFRTSGAKDEWLTPRYITDALGPFDLDPCSPIDRPWATAGHHFTAEDDGLMQEWAGRVWLNPPYGTDTGVWLARLAKHGDGIALVFARTDTAWFFEYIWALAQAVFFFRGRLAFCHVNGEASDSAGAPNVLVAYGEANVCCIQNSNLDGYMVLLKNEAKQGVIENAE